jgi:rhamnosyltransferase subunit B
MRDSSKRIVFTTWGSFGDLHPFMGLALEMQARGHRAAIATMPSYREKVQDAGIDFFPMRPDFVAVDSEKGKEIILRIMDLRDGPRYVMQELLAPFTRDTFTDTVAALNADGGADLMVSHAVPLAAPLVAAKSGIKWLSAVLSPISLSSVYDPPTPPELPWLRQLLLLHPALAKAFLVLLARFTEPWIREVREFRAELGLPPGAHPMFEGQHSPEGVLALFSKVLARLQPDYPANTVMTGFAFYDRDKSAAPPREVMQYLEAGEPPIVFTLGSAAVRVGEDFYRTSIEVARQLKRRALLLVSDSSSLSDSALPAGIAAFDYAPHSLVMPRARVVVHQAGIGTTGQALRSGRPMLIVPHGQDQPDNARRCEELGVGLVLPEKRYHVANAVAKLRELLADPDYELNARRVAAQVRSEHGIATACDAIEAALNRDETFMRKLQRRATQRPRNLAPKPQTTYSAALFAHNPLTLGVSTKLSLGSKKASSAARYAPCRRDCNRSG